MPYPGETSRSTKTTAGGVTYTEVLLTIGGEPCILALPSNPTATLILLAHGHNGSEVTLNSAAFSASLTSFLSSGWPILTSDATGNGWANDASMTAYVAAWQWARTNIATTRTVLYGQSMGGQIFANMLSRKLVSDTLCFVSIDGALNLAVAHSVTAYQPAIRAAYGISSTGSDYATKTAGHDAVLLPPATFNGTKIFLSASTGDTNIPKTQHSDVFATNIAGQPALLTRKTGTGAHVTAGNYFPTDVHDFIAAALLAQAVSPRAQLALGVRIGGIVRDVRDVRHP